MCLQKPIKKIAEFEQHFHELIREIDSEHTVVLFEDESYIRDYQALCSTWFLKGQQKKVKTYGQHKGVGLFGVLDYQNGTVQCDAYAELNAQAFQGFLENIVFHAFEGKHIIMILDNSKIHHAKILEQFKENNKDRIEFLFLPPYAPNINRIEGLWKWLKQSVICNQFLRGIEEIKAAVQGFLLAICNQSLAIQSRLCW
jgi:transposase